MPILRNRNPWLKLAAIYLAGVSVVALIAYVRGNGGDALAAGLTALLLGIVTAVVLWWHRRSGTSEDTRDTPAWRILSWFAVTPALLGIALAIAMANGNTGDAVVIAALLALGVVVFALVAFVIIRHRERV